MYDRYKANIGSRKCKWKGLPICRYCKSFTPHWHHSRHIFHDGKKQHTKISALFLHDKSWSWHHLTSIINVSYLIVSCIGRRRRSHRHHHDRVTLSQPYPSNHPLPSREDPISPWTTTGSIMISSDPSSQWGWKLAYQNPLLLLYTMPPSTAPNLPNLSIVSTRATPILPKTLPNQNPSPNNGHMTPKIHPTIKFNKVATYGTAI